MHAKGLVLCGIGGKRVVGEHLDVSPVVQYLGNLMYQVSYQHYRTKQFQKTKKKNISRGTYLTFKTDLFVGVVFCIVLRDKKNKKVAAVLVVEKRDASIRLACRPIQKESMRDTEHL